MPDALIVCERDFVKKSKWDGPVVNYKRIVLALERMGVVKVVSIKGEKVWGRAYLPASSIRKAYYKQLKGKHNVEKG